MSDERKRAFDAYMSTKPRVTVAYEAFCAGWDARDAVPPAAAAVAYMLRRKSDGLDFGLFMAEEAENESRDEFEFIALYPTQPPSAPSDALRTARLEWALVCRCNCTACDTLHKRLQQICGDANG